MREESKLEVAVSATAPLLALNDELSHCKTHIWAWLLPGGHFQTSLTEAGKNHSECWHHRRES